MDLTYICGFTDTDPGVSSEIASFAVVVAGARDKVEANVIVRDVIYDAFSDAFCDLTFTVDEVFGDDDTDPVCEIYAVLEGTPVVHYPDDRSLVLRARVTK
ncbi:hypothetical protein AB0H73_18850 [Streptomyces olivoreticuli]